ncbi:MAG: hypothetical protein SCARUB_05032, partial [Candidatus Scalindua rubra]
MPACCFERKLELKDKQVIWEKTHSPAFKPNPLLSQQQLVCSCRLSALMQHKYMESIHHRNVGIV